MIIPARPGAVDGRARASLEAVTYRRGGLEVIVVEGRAPARQRNVAVGASRGEHLLFLDEDSAASPELVDLYLRELERDGELGAVGGPAVLSSGSSRSRFERASATVFSEPWVVGKSASRYTPRGWRRLTDERELILCNLAVRRRAFEDVGGFSERLYPNEENDFLDRLQAKGWKLLYRPDAVVDRPQRRSVWELLSTVFRYGRGRGTQLWVGSSRRAVLRLGATGIAGAASVSGLVLGGPFAGLLPLAYLAYLGPVAVRLSSRAGAVRGLSAALLVPLVHGGYAAGLLTSLVVPLRNSRRSVPLCAQRTLRGVP